MIERFLVSPAEFDDSGDLDVTNGRQARITGEEFKHLKTVLRLKVGDVVEVFDGAGRGYEGTLTEVGSAYAMVAMERSVTGQRDSPIRIALGQGIPKSDKMDWIVQKATELGVDVIYPISLARCVTRLDEAAKIINRRTRWQKIASEAAKQSGRLRVPLVMAPRGLDDFLSHISATDLFLVPWEQGAKSLKEVLHSEEGAKPLKEILHSEERAKSGMIYVLIGPEGGITSEEIRTCEQAGGRVLTLGPRILRTETAGLALICALQYHLGDMG
jgi:16S rRNA (uracil1498-N3)-methyltransferase